MESITALGGPGAAAAIQRSFLGFFERFGYKRMGLSCRLREGVCEMDGLAEKGGGYMLVEGGGVPALSVVGYNRRIDWQELLDRLVAHEKLPGAVLLRPVPLSVKGGDQVPIRSLVVGVVDEVDAS